MPKERGQNTHSQGERVKKNLLPYNVDKKSVNNLGLTVGSRQYCNLKNVIHIYPKIYATRTSP